MKITDFYEIKMSQQVIDAFDLLESGERPITEKMQALEAAAPAEDKHYFGWLLEGAIVRDSSDDEE